MYCYFDIQKISNLIFDYELLSFYLLFKSMSKTKGKEKKP